MFDDGKEAYLTERHNDISPILIDLDLRHTADNSNRKYTYEFVENFVEIYIKEIIYKNRGYDVCITFIYHLLNNLPAKKSSPKSL